MIRGRTDSVLVVHPGAELFGSDRMLLESVIGLRESGRRVVVALPSLGPLVDELRRTGAEVVVLPMLVLRKALLKPSGWSRLFRDTFRGAGAAWRLLGRVRPEAVYVSTITIPQWPLIARVRGVRVISHVHEAEASGSRLVNTMLYLPHLAAHRVLVNSSFSLETINAIVPALAARSEILYNGITAPEDPSPPRQALAGPLQIVYIGRLSPRKGPDLVIDAASQLGSIGLDTVVTLVGAVFEGYEWFERELRSKAASASGHTQVRFLGFQDDVWPHLAGADVLVVPSRSDESFGNTAVEGVLARRAVVVSDQSGLREATRAYRAVRVVPSNDAGAVAAALKQLHDDWTEIISSTDADAAEARHRHSPDGYRLSVASAVNTTT